MTVRKTLFLSLLAACAPRASFEEVDWDDFDASWEALPSVGQSPPANGNLTVDLGPMVQGWPAQMIVHGAPAGASVVIARSLNGIAGPGAGECFSQLNNECIDLASPAAKMCEVQADPAGNGGCAISTVPVGSRFTGQELCVQVVLPNGTNPQIGTTDCSTIQHLATPLVVGPDPATVTVNQGRTQQAVISVGNLVPAEVAYTLSSNCPSFVSLNTGGTNPLAGVAPAGGNGQFQVDVDASTATIGDHDCTLTLTPDNSTVAPSTVTLDLEVVAPAITVSVPTNTTTPLNIGGTVTATVTDPNGDPLAGFPTTFTVISDTCDGTFLQNGGTSYQTVTAANGTAFATVTPTENCTGGVTVNTTVTDPSTSTVISTTSTTLTWTATPGNIYFWTISSPGATIWKVPASYLLPATAPVDALPGQSGECVGCHTASPVALPTTGTPELFYSTNLDTMLLGDSPVIAEQAQAPQGASGHNDFNPDATKVVYEREQDIWTYDVLADTWQVVPGANADDKREKFPTFSSDGSHIAYIQLTEPDTVGTGDTSEFDGGGTSSIMTIPTGGGTPVELIPAEAGVAIYYPEFSPDGKWLAFNKTTTDAYGASTPGTLSSVAAEIWVVPVDATGSRTTGPARLLSGLNYVGGTYGSASWPVWSPDSKWLAFSRLATGASQWDIYMASIDGDGQVSPPVGMPQASTSALSEHLPAWGP